MWPFEYDYIPIRKRTQISNAPSGNGICQFEKATFNPKSKVLFRLLIFKMQYLFKEMLLLHTVFNISMYRTCTIMFSEKNLIYSKHSFSITMVIQCPPTSWICIKENILQQTSHNATVIKIMIFSTKPT